MSSATRRRPQDKYLQIQLLLGNIGLAGGKFFVSFQKAIYDAAARADND
jgi:hypothetical protein